MPTPVNSARQCLAGEAAAALDEAVSIARRRAHTQTTSLHIVSALLSLPSSSSSLLRDALSRTRSAAHSPRFQFKALELCFSLALDRLPSSCGKSSTHQGLASPPVSNSLMAAIKRSQATQRRNPDTFHLYQHYQQHQEQISSSSSSSAGVKVELQQLVLSILDDPIVSRVFSDAGFRSYDIKFAVLHPPPSILRLPRAARCPPLFLCNFSIDIDLASRPRLYADLADENCRRIGEVLARKSHRNPLLVGVGAADAAVDFERAVSRQNWLVFPPEARGVKFFSVEKDLIDCAKGTRDEHWLDSRFRDMELQMAEASRSSPGTVLSFGDLKLLVDLVGEDDGLKRVSHAASLMTKLVDDNPEKLWLIGSADTYETYMKFLSQYPSVDKDWDLQLLPISSPRLGSEGLFPRSNRFYPSLPDCSISFNIMPRSHAVPYDRSLMEPSVPLGSFFSVPPSSVSSPKGHSSVPLPCHLCSDKYELELASLLHQFSSKTEAGSFSGSVDLDKMGYISSVQARDGRGTVDAKILDLRKKWADICIRRHRKNPWTGSEAFSGSNSFKYEPKINADELASPLSGSSVSTDLMLGASTSERENSSSKLAETRGYGSSAKAAAAPGGFSMENGDLKGLFRSLLEKVGRQEEAILSICEAISRCRNGSGRLRGSTPRGDVWLSFLGPDKFAKRKVAEALAELLFGSRERLICVDLGSEAGLIQPNTVCGKHETDRFDFTLRGKTLVDHVADVLRRKPWSIVLLESLDKADVLVQSSLSQAIKSGKFHDSHGREVDINNSVFLVTASSLKDKATACSSSGHPVFSEEKILSAKARQMKLLIDTSRDSPDIQRSRFRKSSVFLGKRKLNAAECEGSMVSAKRANLDLNLPVEEMGSVDTNGCCDSDNTDAWMEEFLHAADETVVFREFDFDALADQTLRELDEDIYAEFGFTFALEIEPKTMDQILAVAWISEEGHLKKWSQQVLLRSFIEAHQSYRLSPSSVVRLVALEESLTDNKSGRRPEIPLPASILPCELICHSAV